MELGTIGLGIGWSCSHYVGQVCVDLFVGLVEWVGRFHAWFSLERGQTQIEQHL